MPFYYCFPNTEIHGQALLSLINKIDPVYVRPYVVKHGLVCIEPDKWYAAQTVLNFINDVADQFESNQELPAKFREVLAFRDWLCRQFPVKCSTTGSLSFAV